jgi:hypothetical protein
MQNQAQQIAVALEKDHPGWQVWVIFPAIGSPLYCARRWDGSGKPVSSEDPDELADWIEED